MTSAVKALREESRRQDLKGLKEWRLVFKRYLDKFIENVDPLEMVAVLGVSYLVKNGIDWGQIVTAEILGGFAEVSKFWYKILDPFNLFGLQDLPGISDEEIKQKISDMSKAPTTEIIEWVISIALGFIIVRYFDALIEAGGDVLSLAKSLIGSGSGAAAAA